MSYLRSSLCAGLLLVALATSLVDASAQSSTPNGVRSGVRADLRARVIERDTLLEFRTRRTARGRVDLETGVLRAAYRIDETISETTAPVEAAREYLRANARRFGLAPALEDLRVERVHETTYASHVVFQQMHGGVPVLRRQIKLSLDRERQPSMAVSAYAPHVRDAPDFSSVPSIPVAIARRLAQEALDAESRASEAVLFVHPEKRPRLIWRVLVWPTSGGEWEVLIDAHTGEAVAVRDQATRDATGSGQQDAHGDASSEGAQEDGSEIASSVSPVALVDGAGLVFDPDPVSRAGVSYGGAFVDADGEDVPELNQQRREVVLRDITLGSDGLYRLEGPYVEIVGSGFGQPYSPPASADANGFRYTRADERFEAVMAYYHVDSGQRYVESLEAGTAPPRTVLVNPRGILSDNSEFLPSQNSISFGTGGIDDAEDAGVIRHEHAHAILNATAPGLLSTSEGAAFHEGWADYWSTSLLRHQVESGEIPPRDWSHVFPWDGNNPTLGWCGRFLNHTGHYPDAMAVSPPSGCADYPVTYQHGLLWATTMMEIYTDLGREVTDRLNLASHSYLNAPVTMGDAAEALIQADVDLYGGTHTGVLIGHLASRGFVDGADYGPMIAHDPLPNTESLDGSTRIEVLATGSTADVDSVIVYYGTTPVPVERLVLTSVGDGLFSGELPLPTAPDTLRYYVEAVDVLRRRSYLPEGGETSAFLVIVGPDHTPPIISHAPIEGSSLAAWPAMVVATATDHLSVDSVWVSFSATDSAGIAVDEGTFGLVRYDDVYQAAFPIAVESVSRGSSIAYRIHARDDAAAENESVAPESGSFSFEIIETGVLRAYDFEHSDASISADGVWERGPPTHGVRVAHSGDGVWATRLSGPYPDFAQRSTLELPPLNLQALGQTYLVFWHWYDFEHDGQVLPESSGRTLWDGGNVKVSVDGQTWAVVTPVDGYNGVLDASLENPLGGEPAFGGYSHGWRRSVVPLPASSAVRVRFEFGTDVSNEDESVAFAGWFLDDVMVTTDVPEDAAWPTVTTPLEPEVLRAPGQTPPRVMVRAFDDVGVALAEVRYELYPSSGTPVEGNFRLSMADTSVHQFEGNFPALGDLTAGDRIEFRVLIRDFAGNEVYMPETSEPPFRVLFRNLDRVPLLVQASPSGLWMKGESAWRVGLGPQHAASGLVLERIDLPANAERLTLELTHRYELAAGAGGNVKITDDGGSTWKVLSPVDGYPATFDVAPPHPMLGEGIFGGTRETPHVSRFDVSPYAGGQIQLRFDFGLTRVPRADDSWVLSDAALLYATEDGQFDIPRSLALHPNFPDPFSHTTTISYTLPASAHVQIDVYDLLGRRVAVLVDAEQDSGTYTREFDGSSLAAGLYLLRMRVGSDQRVERLLKVR